jgi:hypothetical protein
VTLPIFSEPCAAVGCRWSHHGYKHFAARGATRADTALGPAKYLSRLDAHAISALEDASRRTPTWRGGNAAPLKTEYLRSVGEVIGWDEGQDASLSYVECSGGAARSFHGRPMHEPNRLARRIAERGR